MEEEVVIKAYNGNGSTKVLAGELRVKKPRTVASAIELYGEEVVLKSFWSSFVIETQRKLRSKSTINLKDLLITEAVADKNKGDSVFYDRLVQLGVIHS